jgi:enoyl-CoA hydratase/carnithine racemase
MSEVTVEIDEVGVAVVTLSNPEGRNAFAAGMGDKLGEAYRRCDADDAVRVIVVTGDPAGRAFCAGADIAGQGAKVFGDQRGSTTFSAAAFDPPAFTLRKLVIAAVNGHAIGLGWTLALQADIRVVASDAKLQVAQVQRGVMPDAYSHWTVVRLAGMAVAADLLLTGRIISGTDAVAMGLARTAVHRDEVLSNAIAIARDAAVNTAPLSVAVSKRLLWQSLELSWQQVGHAETELHRAIMGRPDSVEGVAAFMERRAPNWTLSAIDDFPQWPLP